MTFADLDRVAYAIDRSHPAFDGVNYYMAHADDNAVSDADKMASLIHLLAFCKNEATLAWFEAYGVRP